MHLAVATDAAYLPWTAVAILSALDTTTRTVSVHLLHAPDVAPADLQRLAAMCVAQGGELDVLPVDDAELADLPSKGPDQGERMSWARVLLPERLAGVARVIYLDADVLVMDPLDELWERDLGGRGLAAVANVVEPAMHAHVRSLGLRDPAQYFNAGMLLIDLDWWRRERVRQLVTEVAAGRPDSPWYDQDALNVVFADRWLRLHPRWNAMNSLWTWEGWARDVHGAEAVAEAVAHPAVLHFEGPWLRKPWHQLSQHPATDTYLATLARTPWPGAAPVDRTVATRLIGRMPAGWQTDLFLRLQRRRGRRG